MCEKLEKPRQNHAEEIFVDESFITKRSFLQLIGDSLCVQKISAHVPFSIVYPKANLYYAFAEDIHPMKRIVTASKLFEKEKLLPQAVSGEELFNQDHHLKDSYSKDEAVNHYLRTNPPSFVIFGKPGLDHANVASAVADAWNCVLISPTSLIRREIDTGTDKGRYLEKILRLGRSIGPEILMNLIRCRVRTRDVKHRGYVIGCLPFISSGVSFDYSYSDLFLDADGTYPEFCENAAVESHEADEDRITFHNLDCKMQFDYEREIPRQIDEIFTVWPRKPLIIIYLVCPKQDVASRCARQRVNYLTGDIFDENEFMQLSEHDELDTSFDFFQIANGRLDADDDQRLVKLISDMTRNVETQCDLYERLALPEIDKWILAHNPQRVVHVDGRSSVRRILQILKTRLHTLALLPSILPKEMIKQNDARFLETFPDMSDELAEKSAEETFEILRRREVVSLRFPWRLSAWKFYCPVELAQGRTVKGFSKHAVRFLDKIFFLSSQEAKNLFVENPRTFLLPPNPRSACKIAVFGPKYAGKSELSTRLAEIFGGTVINVDEIVKEIVKQREKHPFQELYENDSNVEQVPLKPIDISVDEKADIIIRNIKRIPDEKLEDELRRDGGYVVDGMFMDVEIWRKIVDEANIVFEDVVVLFEEEPYTYLLNKFRTFSHFDDSMDDTETDREEHRILYEDAEWEYLEHLTRFESEWTTFEEQIPEFRGNVIKCNLADIEDVIEHVINYIRHRFDIVTTNNKEKNKTEETIVENEANLADKDAEEKKEENLIYTIDLATAEQLLDCGYYFFSSFGRWCPVQMYNVMPIPMFLPMKARGQIFPVVYHPHIYFLAGEEALSAFLNDPSKYLAQDLRLPLLPLRISIIGPPKCGKTTLANRFAKTYGMKIITRGKALRHILKYYPWTESARIIEDQLRAGQAVSIESVARAVEMFSIEPRAATQGYILDNCPSNRKETEQLALLGIQPMIVLDLKADLEFCLECLSWDNDDTRSPLNFNANFLSQLYEDWQTSQASFRDWIKRFSQNVVELDATKTRRVPVPDTRFDYLCEYFKPASKVPAFLHVMDIAGLVKGASEGQGLGNSFLSHIGACDGIFHLCRAFEDDDVTHVEGDVNPVRDLDIISEELRLKDVEFLNVHLEKLEKLVIRGNDKKLKPEYDTLLKVKGVLADEKKHIRFADWSANDIEVLNKYLFLTSKPILYLVNLSEKDYIRKKNKWLIKIKEWVDKNDPGAVLIPFSGVFENKILDMDEAERAKYFEEHKVTSALDKIIVQGYKALQLQYFFTSGHDEVKAWTIQKGTKAPQAAGKIHTDFEKGFIMAEVMKFEDFKNEGSEAAVKAAGKYRQQGRNYVVEDGDIIFFKFNAGAGLKDAKKK